MSQTADLKTRECHAVSYNRAMIPKVREWLDTQGYLLEIRTASAFRAAGFDLVSRAITSIQNW